MIILPVGVVHLTKLFPPNKMLKNFLLKNSGPPLSSEQVVNGIIHGPAAPAATEWCVCPMESEHVTPWLLETLCVFFFMTTWLFDSQFDYPGDAHTFFYPKKKNDFHSF